jgi:pteridine reductase
MALNARPVLVLSRAAAPRLRERAGAIVNVACTSGLSAWKGYLAYSASKAAVISLTQGFAKALAPEVRVNAVAPGPVLPPDDLEPARRETVAATTLLGRWGAPSDVAEAVVFLAAAPWLTGVVLPVDGGRSVR